MYIDPTQMSTCEWVGGCVCVHVNRICFTDQSYCDAVGLYAKKELNLKRVRNKQNSTLLSIFLQME